MGNLAIELSERITNNCSRCDGKYICKDWCGKSKQELQDIIDGQAYIYLSEIKKLKDECRQLKTQQVSVIFSTQINNAVNIGKDNN